MDPGTLREAVLARLSTVIDPETGVDVVRMIAFGPVPSRRLGRSLGVNHVPPKICTYSCAYCQLGRTIKMQVERQPFYKPEQVVRAVQEQVEKAGRAGVRVDYLTFVPDGEPTLDANLDGFVFTGDVEEDLLSITAVHPMREEAVGKLLARSQADWSTVRRLVAQGRLVQVEYGGRVFYLRKLGR